MSIFDDWLFWIGAGLTAAMICGVPGSGNVPGAALAGVAFGWWCWLWFGMRCYGMGRADLAVVPVLFVAAVGGVGRFYWLPVLWG